MSKLGALNFSKHTGHKHTATIIFFHGSGSNGKDMKEWVKISVKNFNFPHIKVLYPTAPIQHYSPAGGQMSNVWFDRAGIAINVPEKLESIAKIEGVVKELIRIENDAGIPSERILVGGFSMGGALALYTAYNWDTNLAGAFACSSFLNDNSFVYDGLRKAPGIRLPPLLQIHGDIDELVPASWGRSSYDQLKMLGVQGDFYMIERLGHAINKRGMAIVKDWVTSRLPQI